MRTRSVILASLLVTTFLAALAAPVASAHTCQAQDPKTSCGECSGGLVPLHRHTYTNGDVYCASTVRACNATFCAEIGLTDLLP